MSRTALLLERELHRINRMDEASAPWGLSVEVVLNNIFEWKGTILGAPDTPWEGAILKVKILFDEDYNETPPQIVFLTIPFHPNIDMHTGAPCLRLLDDAAAWEPETSILNILLTLQDLIANPILENPVNIPACEIYTQSPRLYAQLCRDCVVASRRLDAGLRPYSSTLSTIHSQHTSSSTHPQSATPSQPRLCTIPQPQQPTTASHKKHQVTRLSFEEYHAFWKASATSMPPEPVRKEGIPRPVRIRFDGVTPHGRMTEHRFKDMVEQQRVLWYGKFNLKRGEGGTTAGTAPEVRDRQHLSGGVSQSLNRAQEVEEKVAAMRRAYSLTSPSVVGMSRNELNSGLGGYDERSRDPSDRMEASFSGSSGGGIALISPEGVVADGSSYALPPLSKADSSVLKSSANLISDAISREEDHEWEMEAMELEQWANDLE
ncbi:hypothetical protein CcCBS67573_g02866 [Chytriomyces confervae]|uniref:UBC core domain-containing protein n=1 Tax=Chytriomyces confervae TaxID=246404 RepID=A0A507FI33_9FUNG|nr:hypothetical protein CcCBS67573_g02866 [Chytriomyces confervae]